MKSKQDWIAFGDNDPFFGVLSDEKYKKTNLTENGFEEFFSTGADYVKETSDRIQHHYNEDISNMDVLDFGCGVGRLAIPFVRKTSGKVIGLDVSEGMIKIAQEKGAEHKNLRFVHYSGRNIPDLGTFDLVNSYIVIQHIEPAVGYDLVEQLCKKVKIGGYLHLQIPYGHNIPKLNYLKFYLKVNSDLYNRATNFFKTGKFIRTPVMQMNYYSPEKLDNIFNKYTEKVHLEHTDHGGHLGNFYFFKRVK